MMFEGIEIFLRLAMLFVAIAWLGYTFYLAYRETK